MFYLKCLSRGIGLSWKNLFLFLKANDGKWFRRGRIWFGCMVGAWVMHGGRVSRRPRVVNVAHVN